MKLAARMSQLGIETAFEVLAKARALEAQGKEIIHLEIGEPDFDTPKNVVEAGVTALRGGFTHYSPAAGIPELRQAIARHVAETRGIPVTPTQVVVTPGAKPIMFYALLALAEPGDEVIFPDPGFPIYASMIRFSGAKPVPLTLRAENQFRFDPDEFKKKVSPRTKLIILNSPHNPTGAMMSRAEVEAVADVARQRDIMVLSDEVYWRIRYEGEHVSPASLPGMAERTIILDGFSKIYAMTGWRLGYGVMREDLAAHITRLMVNSNSCTATFTQRAGIEALQGSQAEAEKMVAAFRQRRDVIVAGLNRIPGLSCVMPQGAFYVFPSVRGTGKSSADFAEMLLNDAGVACLKGESFGEGGRGYIRLSYANSVDNLEKALDRIEDVVKKVRR